MFATETRGRSTHVRTRRAFGRQAALWDRDLPHRTARGRAAGFAQARPHFVQRGRDIQGMNRRARLLSRGSRCRGAWPDRQPILSHGPRGRSLCKSRNNRRIGKAQKQNAGPKGMTTNLVLQRSDGRSADPEASDPERWARDRRVCVRTIPVLPLPPAAEKAQIQGSELQHERPPD